MAAPAVIRAFIAIEIPRALRDELAAQIGRLQQAAPAGAARWVRPEGIHLTLKFLGDVPAAQVAGLGVMLEEVAAHCAPFELVASGLGCFPNCAKPRVVWAGLRDTGNDLHTLQQAVDDGAARLGFAREEKGRGFNPHLTLARAARDARPPDARRLGELVQGAAVGDLGRLPVEHIALMRSDLQPGGAVYTRLSLARLGGASEISRIEQ